jgi:hypothetical protein
MAGVVAALLLAAVAVGSALDGAVGIQAAALAAIVCLSGSLLGLLIVNLARRRGQMLAGVLMSMAPRMGLPLGFCLLMHLRGGALVEAGIVFYVLAFYIVTLAVETWLLVDQLGLSQPGAGGLSPNHSSAGNG